MFYFIDKPARVFYYAFAVGIEYERTNGGRMKAFTLKYTDDYGFEYEKEFDTMEELKAFVAKVGLEFYKIERSNADTHSTAPAEK